MHSFLHIYDITLYITRHSSTVYTEKYTSKMVSTEYALIETGYLVIVYLQKFN